MTRLALIQVAWSGSRTSMKQQYMPLIAYAVAQGATLICLPEFSLLPYFPGKRDPAGFDWSEALDGGESDTFFAEQARTHHVALIGSFFERTADGTYYDVATLYDADGIRVGYTRKIHIPSGEGYHENEYFGGGDAYPVFNAAGLPLATPTCYDQWFPELARAYALNGAHLLCYPSAIGSEPTDPDIDTADAWQTVMRGHAIANGVFIAAVNRVGSENGVRFYGSSFICDPMGRVLAQAGRATTEVVLADLDPHTLAHWRDLFPLLTQRRPETYGRLIN
ncbi:MAG: hydrolase [Armatimonadetes bacterium]|nr:hydrolase [Anaerolineae bacterium]